MEEISDVSVTSCKHSDYIKMYRTTYKQDKLSKSWDFIKVHDSVAAIIYNKSQDALLFVRQFRPAVYLNSIPWKEGVAIDVKKYPPSKAITYELCAGIVDKEKSVEEIMKEEILEECGYDVPLLNIEKITSFRSSVGVGGSVQTLFYAEVTNEMRVSSGGGCILEGENIQVEEIPVSEARNLMLNEDIVRSAGLMFALLWFYDIKLSILQV